MSFMREIISLVSENEAVDARDNITRCIEQIRDFQHQIRRYIDDEYSEYFLHLANNKLHLTEGGRLCEEADNLLQNIANETKNDLLAAQDDLGSLVEELQEVHLGLGASLKILRIDALFAALETSRQNHEYSRVMEATEQIRQLLDATDDAILPRLDCYPAIRQRYLTECRLLLHSLRQQFEQLVQLGERKFQKTKSASVRITRDEQLLHETMVPLMLSAYDPRPMCDFLLEQLFVPIVRQPVSLQLVESDARHVSLTLSYSLAPLVAPVAAGGEVASGGEVAAADLRPNYRDVFANIKQVFQCLGHMNISLSPEVCVFGVIAREIKERFLRLLIDECLAPSVPSTMDEMNGSRLVEDLLEFDRFLCDMLFLSETEDAELRDFAQQVDELFKNRFCTTIVASAVAIMRHDLHDMVLVGGEQGEASGAGKEGSDAEAFPRCMVSKSTTELTSLMDKVIAQTATSKDELSVRLFATIPTIVDRYLTEVPTYHAKLLQNIPQQTALFHNNCQYLAHWLTMNATRASRSAVASAASAASASAASSASSADSALFTTWTKPLRQCGSAHFGQQIAHQRDQLAHILRDFDIAKCTDELDPLAAKIVRQCLRQLDLLKNVWRTILPADVYNRTMAAVLNELCSELIRRVLLLDDIPAAVCSGLVELFEDVERRAPQCFADELRVSVLCRSWVRMQQLRMMLNASMAQIVEQWAEGKGPLTLHWKADEVKRLVRALFQNTDRRANALATIY